MFVTWAFIKGIQLAVTALDNYIHRIEKAEEKLAESTKSFEDATSELRDIQKELEETDEKMSALESEGITIVNENEYNQLVETNKELERTIALKKIEQELIANQSASDASDLYQVMTENTGTPSKEHYEKLVKDGSFSALMLDTNDAENNIDVLLAYYTQVQTKISDIKSEIDSLVNKTDEDSKQKLQELQYQLEDSDAIVNDISEAIKSNLKKYQEIFDGIKPKVDLGIELSIDEQEALDSANAALDLINYVFSSRNDRLDDFISESGIGTSLKQLVNSGKSTIEVMETIINRYPELLSYMNENGISIEDLIKKYTELGEAEKSAAQSAEEIFPATISSSVQQIATQLEPQFAKLGEAYQNIFTNEGFTRENINNEMLEGLRASFADIEEELGVAFDPSVLNPFFDKLTDGTATAEQVQQAFNDLATSWFYSTDTLEKLNEETAAAIEKQLEEMGVVNAHEVITASLAEKQLELAASKEYLAQTSKNLSSATGSEIAAFGMEQVAANSCSAELALFYLEKTLLSSTSISTITDVNNILTLANAAGVTTEALVTLSEVKAEFENALASGNMLRIASAQVAMTMATAKVKKDIANFEPVKIDFSKVNPSSGSGSAKSTGKEAADEYLESFKKELAQLDDLRDRGKITEKEYLDQLRKLYEKYFKDKKKYLDEFEDYEHQYLDGMKSLYQSVFSTIISKYNDKIDAANDAKDAAVSALEEEKDAAIAALESQKEAAEKAYQAQIDAIQIQIDSKQEIIDGIQDEIDAMRDANEERQREIDLQKAKYELERSIHQRTNLIYRSDKGFVWEADPTAIRDNQQAVEDAKMEIEIANKEKQIKLIEQEITVLEKQQDAIQDMIDRSNEYYDNLIEQTEKQYDEMIKQTEMYWDAIIKSMEDYKSRYEELSDMESDAKAMADLKELCETMGITVDDVLNMSDEAFQAFRDNYTNILADIYSGNDQMTSALAEQAGKTTDQLGSYLADTQEFIDGINALNLSETADGLSETADGITKVADSADAAASSLDKVSSSSSTAQTNTQGVADAMSSLEGTTTNVSGNIDTITNSLNNMPQASQIGELSGMFERLAGAIVAVSKALGISEEGSIGGLATALSNISMTTLEGDEGGLITQFTRLKDAVSSVSAAIDGGGNSEEAGASKTSTDQAGESGNSGSSSLTGALDTLKTTADATLGGSEDSGDSAAEGKSGVIGQFDQLKQSVTDVTSAIGGGEESEGVSSGDGESNSLIGSLETLQETADDILGEPGEEGLIHKFEEFKEPIVEASNHVTGISEALEEIDGQDVECTIRVNIETTGGLPAGIAHVSGTALADMNLSSGTYTANMGKAHAEGTAKASGDWAVHNGGMSLLGELGQEMVVRNGRFFTVGDSGAQFVKLFPGDIVFNHKQTEELLKNGQISSRGKAYAEGSTGRSYADGSEMNVSTTTLDPERLKMYQTFSDISDKLDTSNTIIGKINDQIEKNIQNINNVQNVQTRNDNVKVEQNIEITCPNVTDKSGMEYINKELRRFYLDGMQYFNKK